MRPGEGERVDPAHRQTEEGEAVQPERVGERFDVGDHRPGPVEGSPVAVAVTALVQRDDPPFGDRLGQPAPGRGMTGEAVEHEEGRRGVGAPRQVVETQARQRDVVRLHRGSLAPPPPISS
jgi:hypothetical protein